MLEGLSRKRRPSSRKTRTVSTEQAGGIVFTLTRKNVKNLNITVRLNGEVKVSAPFHMPLTRVEEFVESKSDWIVRALKQNESSPSFKAESASKEEKEQWAALVRSFAPPLIEKWEKVLGVNSQKLVYRDMKSRWGSCQPDTGRICLNTRLALYPPECLEYVVVHELCHMIVRGHGKDFHDLMDDVMPDWKTRRAKLR